MDNTEDILKKAIKLYVTGKHAFTTDKVKARSLFQQSLDALNIIKKNSNFKQLIQSTEAECIKYLHTANNIFELIKVNDLDTIKKMDHINFREINIDGSTVLHYAIDIGDIGILKELLKKGGMIDTVDGHGNTLLEYACLKKDPNIITFILLHGANMQKHLFFRKGERKYYLNKSDIDLAILLKLILINSINKTEFSSFSFLANHISPSELVGLDKYTVRDIMIGLHHMFLNKESYKTYATILQEELTAYDETPHVAKCIYNKMDIILTNLVVFINYPFNLGCIFVLKNEIKYLMKNILRNNENDFKNILMTRLFDTYIQNNLFSEDYIGVIVYNMLSKIKL